MNAVLILSNVALIVFAVIAIYQIVRYRMRLRRQKDIAMPSPIPLAQLSEFHELFNPGDLGIPLQAEVSFLGVGDGAPAVTSDMEAWILSVLAKPANCMFEFGTGSGRTSYLWAKNSTPDAKITTITLHPNQHLDYRHDSADDDDATDAAKRESIYSKFIYSGTVAEQKINQLFGDSKLFDESPYKGACDLIFIDGSHSYSYVKNDTEKAFRMLKSGGIILWHDYRNDLSHTKGVYDFLNELFQKKPLVRLRGTSLVAYRYN
jgi:predicted O-methyltransferase YrrM